MDSKENIGINLVRNSLIFIKLLNKKALHFTFLKFIDH